MSMARVVALGLLGFSLLGCSRSPGYVRPTVAVPEAAPEDEAAELLLKALERGNYDVLAARTSEPLTSDLSKAEFDDVAAIVQWLGPLESRNIAETKERRHNTETYVLQFDRGRPVQLEVSVDPTGQLIGFIFSGEGFIEAERGVLAEPWREFKVYDFHLLDPEGTRLEDEAPVAGTRVEYEVIVGGIEAMLGAHHLRVEKTVLDAGGSPVFREPIEFDTTFDQDAMGVPRGTVRGHVEVPGPGRWTMKLVINDENAHRAIEHEYAFETK